MRSFTFPTLCTLAMLGIAALPVAAAPKTSPAAVAKPVSPEMQGDTVLREMSAKLAKAQTFGFTAVREISPALLEGRDVPEKARVAIVVQRANKLAGQAVSATGTRRFVFDGENLTVLDAKANHYSVVPMRTDIDGLVDRLDKHYGFTPPLVEFALSNPYADFRRQAKTVTYLGRGRTLGGLFGLGGVACHRVELKGKEADAELWVGVDDNLPRKLVATFHREGKPQVKIEFLKWNLDAKVTSAEFAFTPPQGAEKVEMWTTAKMQAQRKR